MRSTQELAPAHELAARAGMRFPNESDDYRAARTALLAEEIELRRHIEHVAEMRRSLPPGGEVKDDYKFTGANGVVRFAELFDDKPTLITYSFMFGPERREPCPMCTSLLSAWDGEADDIEQRAALGIIARSPIERLTAFAEQRGWPHLKLYSDTDGRFSRDYHALSEDGEDIPALNVFTRRDGKIRHFWSGEMNGATADPGQDPRGAPDVMPIWTLFDLTPEGRGQFYPKLRYSTR